MGEDKFKLFKKWFWIGFFVGLFNIAAGLLYGIALAIEPEHRREGVVLIVWTVFWAILTYQLGVYLTEEGYVPRFQIVEPGKLFFQVQ